MEIILPKLNLPHAVLKFSKEKDVTQIWDIFRNKWIKLQPEEWVRQNYLHYMCFHKEYPKSRIKLEYRLNIGNTIRRCDAVFFDKMGKPQILCEFKAPDVNLTSDVLHQVGLYDTKLGAEYLVISNGIKHIIAKKDNLKFDLINELPIYS